MTARNFLKTRFRAVPGQQDEGDHWIGGEPFHKGAVCPVCKIPPQLLWDINCRDSRFPRGKFGPLERLPLYFCWGCVSDLAYQILPNGRLKMLRSELMREGPDFPYDPYPSPFERKPLALVSGVPDDVRAVLAKWYMAKEWTDHNPTAAQRRILEPFFGHRVPMSLCLFHSQLGGPPSQRWWGEEAARCPNKECPTGLLGKLRGGRGRAMSFVAGVINDPLRGLPMVEPHGEATEGSCNFFVSVAFQICGKCWTVHACNRSD